MNSINLQDLSGKSSELPSVKILWTGGYDSSFRMIQLSKYNVAVQPYYLCDNLRRSQLNELAAITAITADIEMHPETRCTILPIIKFKVSDLEPDKEISGAYQRLRKMTAIGPQYEWLSRFAKTNNGLELCLEKADTGKAYNCIVSYGAMKSIKNGDIAYRIIDEGKSSPDLIKLFGGFHFPLPLFEITKSDMQEEYKKMGFGKTLDKTWFCHNPVNNEPCGICNPCKAVMEDGLSFRLSPAGLKRYQTEMEYGNYRWYEYMKKFRRRIIGY